VATTLVVSIMMLLSVPVVGRLFGRPNVVVGDTPQEEARLHEQEEARDDRVGATLRFLTIGGFVGIGLSLTTGLVIAFGVGPSWMASQRSGLVVQDTFAEDSDQKYFGPSAPDVPGVRYYVRARDGEGKLTEFHTDRATYSKIRQGQSLNVRVLGRRLVSIDRVEERGDV